MKNRDRAGVLISTGRPARLDATQWTICVMAAMGFAFDIYEILMLPLIVRSALADLARATPGTEEFNFWVGMLFWLPLVIGGSFGLLGGYLIDRFGRRRVLVWSIQLYALSACAAAFSTSVGELLVWRSLVFVGVFVEFVAAVAWLAELFPDPKQREAVLGYTQAFSSAGGLMVAGAYYLAVTFADSLPAIANGHEPWRYTMISGVIPAIPLMIIRPFLPESAMWKQKKLSGTLKRPSFLELFHPALRRTTLITALMVACTYATAFGAMQFVPQIVPGLDEVKNLSRAQVEKTVSTVQIFQEVGAFAGRLALGFLASRIISRRLLLRTFQIPGLIMTPLLFLLFTMDLDLLKWGILIASVVQVAQHSFWGNYLPRVYPTHLRGTGESFAANIGGRLAGGCAGLLTAQLANVMPGVGPSHQIAYSAAAVALLFYGVGFAASFFLPEPKWEKLPD